jgi:hypothetical protein
VTLTTLREPQERKRARLELNGGWVAAVIAVLAVVGLFQVSDPGSGSEHLIWYLAPAMFLSSASAAWLGLRARRDGEEGGRWPALVGFVVGGFFVLMLLLALVGHLLGFE